MPNIAPDMKKVGQDHSIRTNNILYKDQNKIHFVVSLLYDCLPYVLL